mmetsp:Transcript_1372/g.1693  ORF Transcript_1372/g.1693 Transcript_1372/m.1693 type:complete len:179 (+) Transcript_1372:29-565(+)
MNRRPASDNKQLLNYVFEDDDEQSDVVSSSLSRPYLRRVWSDDESTLATLSTNSTAQYIKKRDRTLSSNDDSTVNSKDELPSFYDLSVYFQKMVSRSIRSTANSFMNREESESREEDNFVLKDEDFFWNPVAGQSFDTVDTRKTTELKKSSFSKWDQGVNLWQTNRVFRNSNNYSEES